MTNTAETEELIKGLRRNELFGDDFAGRAAAAFSSLLANNKRLERELAQADEMTTKIAILSHAGMCSMSPQRMFDILEEIYGLCEAAGFDSVGGRKAPVSRK